MHERTEAEAEEAEEKTEKRSLPNVFEQWNSNTFTDKDLRSTDTGVRGVAHPSFIVAVVLEKAAKK